MKLSVREPRRLSGKVGIRINWWGVYYAWASFHLLGYSGLSFWCALKILNYALPNRRTDFGGLSRLALGHSIEKVC